MQIRATWFCSCEADFFVKLLLVLSKLNMVKLSSLKFFPVLLSFPHSALSLVRIMLSDLFTYVQPWLVRLGSWALDFVPGVGWMLVNKAGPCPPEAHALEQNFSALCWGPLPIIWNRAIITIMLMFPSNFYFRLSLSLFLSSNTEVPNPQSMDWYRSMTC